MPSNSRNNRLPDRYQMLLSGDLHIEDLDDEELARGQLRNKNGEFTGRPPLAIPNTMYKRVVEVMTQRVEAAQLGHLGDMYDVLFSIATNPGARPDARNTAAIYIIERLTGKIPDKAVIQQQISIWDQMIGGPEGAELIVDLEVTPAIGVREEDIVDAEIVEDEPPVKPKPVRKTRRRTT